MRKREICFAHGNKKGSHFCNSLIKKSLSIPSGKLVFHVFGALAEFERNLIKERTNAGLAAVRAKGRIGGRPIKLSEINKKMVVEFFDSKNYTIIQICEQFGISKPTLYKFININPVE
ncbi:MAG: recombinase family protein [Leadbetterella sp.]|nr:recombinase family protein [Leadbetterella sp.]